MVWSVLLPKFPNLVTRLKHQPDPETLAHQAPVLMWMATSEGGIFWYNQRWYEYTGTTPEQMQSPERQLVHDPEILPDLRARFQESLRTGSPFEMVFPLRGADGVLRPFLSRAVPLRDSQGRITRWLGASTDITGEKTMEAFLQMSRHELQLHMHDQAAKLAAALEREKEQRERAERDVHELTIRLLRLQDDERRRIARELHDSAGQALSILGINIGLIQQNETIRQDANLARAVCEAADSVRELSRQLGTISYLLHPPLLDEMGLESALRWLVNGFSERSQIDTKLEISPGLGRLPAAHELTAFRIVQECLTNIHRHSGSRRAVVRVRRGAELTVEVTDWGRGMTGRAVDNSSDADRRRGVGIAGMHERVWEFNGTLEIQSGTEGTTVTASLPLRVI